MRARAWWARLRGSLRRDDVLEREMEQEMEFHVSMSARRNVERGMTPEKAGRAAKVAFGSMEAYKEEAREAHRLRAVEKVVLDVRYALRNFRRTPSFAVAAVLTVALGIGSSTAMFTVVDAALLRPLPIPDPETFTYLGWAWGEGDAVASLSALQYEYLRDNNQLFESVAAYRAREAQLGGGADATSVRGLSVDVGFFRTMGFTPRLGRMFEGRELSAGGPAVVVLGDGVWRTRFGGDPGILGREIRLDEEPHTVVGILPPEYRFPPAYGHTGFLTPLVIEVEAAGRGNNTDAVARLRPRVAEADRAAALIALSRSFRETYPALPDSGSFRLFTHAEVHVGQTLQHTLWVLFGAVSLVLLIACTNTAALLLVRASTRQREIAVRAAIGAGPGRIVQQLITEGLVLALAGAVLGVLIGVVAVNGFVAAAPRALPAGLEPGMDRRVLGFAIAACAGSGLIFGLAAAGPARRTRLQAVLLGASRGATGGGTRIREALVLMETAIAVVLLAGAALLAASFTRLIRVDPGFDAERVFAVRLGSLPPEYDGTRREQLMARMLERVRAIPGVERAAAAPNLPLERGLNFPVDIAERPERGIGAVELRFVSSDYLATLGIPLRSGRDFNDRDAAGAEPVAIVNEAFARHFWDDASPVGRFIRIGHFRDRWLVADLQHQTRVVGVAADIHEVGLDRPARPTVLLPRPSIDRGPGDRGEATPDGTPPLPSLHSRIGTPVLLVRASTSVATRVREAIVAEESKLVPEIEQLSAVVNRSVAGPRFRTMLLGAFAGFALLLAGIGIYGVIASVVQQRWREIGVRMALGADRADVTTVVVRRCLANVAAGTLLGLIVFWSARRVLSSWLYEITAEDPQVLAGALAILSLVAACACWIPARRATRMDPAASLRIE